MFLSGRRVHRGKGFRTQCVSFRLFVLTLPGWGPTSFSMRGSSRTGRIQPSGFTASANTDGRAHCLLVQCSSMVLYGPLWAEQASTGLEEEVTALVGAVTDEDSGTFSSWGGKSASIAPIVGRGSWPSIMF